MAKPLRVVAVMLLSAAVVAVVTASAPAQVRQEQNSDLTTSMLSGSSPVQIAGEIVAPLVPPATTAHHPAPAFRRAVAPAQIDHDVAVFDLDVPFPNLAPFVTQQAVVQIENIGVLAQSAVPVTFRVDDAPAQHVLPALPLAAGAADTVAFAWAATAGPGVYRLAAWTDLALDQDRSNDTVSVAGITVYPEGIAELGYDDRFNPSQFISEFTSVVNFSVLEDLRGLAPTYNLHQVRIDFVNTTTTDDRVRVVVATAVDDTTLGGVLLETMEPVPAGDFSSHYLPVNALGLTAPRLAVLLDFSVSGGQARVVMDGRTPFAGHNFFFNGTRWAPSNFGRQVRAWISWLAAPRIISVRDVPNDQGRQVHVCWWPSPNEAHSREVRHYVLWRATRLPASAGAPGYMGEAGRLPGVRDYNLDRVRPGDRVAADSGGVWDYIATIPAHAGFEAYCCVAPTLADSTAAGIPHATFMVSAYDANGLFVDSAVDSGYSVDNIAPATPAQLSARQISHEAGPAVQLTWEANTEEDFGYYALYKNGGTTPLAQLIDMMFVDTEVQYDVPLTYRLTAVDVNGNESPAAVVTLQVTGVKVHSGANLPEAYKLSYNYPNPFNPQTTIAFDMPAPGRVQLTILNAMGQEIALLLEREMPAGRHHVNWTAPQSASGVYFYRLRVHGRVLVKRMVLLQ